MIVKGPFIRRKDENLVLSAKICSERFPFFPERIWWRFSKPYPESIAADGNALIPALLIPCMARGERLVIEAPVSEQLIANVPKIQKLLIRWLPNLHPIQVTCPILSEPAAVGNGVGCFFSGGVDSFYSLLQNEAQPESDKISHLLLIQGFDVKLKHRDLYRRLRDHLESTAQTMNKSLLEVGTNLKTFGDRSILWDYYHGSVLASVGLALGPLFRKIVIPSSYSTEQLIPFGSHPELDHLWSTQGTQFCHDECESRRIDKVGFLSQSPLAMEHLRVCWRNRDVFYNCGVCEKCLRTMIALYIKTGRRDWPTFPHPLDPDAVRQMKLKGSNLVFAKENLAALEKRLHSDFDMELKQALTEVIQACSP